jgi:hypothetical protein
MTSPRPETTDRSEQTEDKEKTQGVQLSATQVAAGALAAVSSAVVASFFGLAGTLIGAALASVISTVSAALYSSSLQKTNEKLRRARGQLPGRQAAVEETKVAPAAPATQVLPAHLDPRRAPDRRPRPRWTKVAVYAAAVFVMAMGIVTGIELIGQRPVSALVGGADTSTTTTIGAITNASSSSAEQDDDPSTPSSPTTTAPATETSAPTTGTDDESTSEEDEGSDSEESSPTPTRTSEAEPTTDSEPSDSSDGSSEDSSQESSSQDSSGEDTSPAAGAEPTP